jgi:lipoprotein NlpD
VVASGDKLQTIAWRYGLDVRDLIRWNQITNPDLIVVGQTLRLRPPAPPPPPSSPTPRAPTVMTQAPTVTPVPANGARAAAPVVPTSPHINMAPLTPLAATPATSTVTPTPAPAPSVPSARVAPASTESSADNDKPAASDSAGNAAANKAGVRWMWPAQGKVSAADAESATKGIDIRGTRGQPVKAAAGGTVVYSGSGLRGYGELIIVQHNDTFLSAYAHNEARLVQEGRHVDAGETIARMGNSDTTDVMLHFEIRRNGKAVDPLQYLPTR